MSGEGDLSCLFLMGLSGEWFVAKSFCDEGSILRDPTGLQPVGDFFGMLRNLYVGWKRQRTQIRCW